MLNIVLIGGPGAGKGTQARLLKEHLRIPQVASGELFRTHLKNNSEWLEYCKSGNKPELPECTGLWWKKK